MATRSVPELPGVLESSSFFLLLLFPLLPLVEDCEEAIEALTVGVTDVKAKREKMLAMMIESSWTMPESTSLIV